MREIRGGKVDDCRAGNKIWKIELKNENTSDILKLYVFDLGNSLTNNQTEAIEAEIVYEIRKMTNQWPLY